MWGHYKDLRRKLEKKAKEQGQASTMELIMLFAVKICCELSERTQKC